MTNLRKLKISKADPVARLKIGKRQWDPNNMLDGIEDSNGKIILRKLK